MALRTSGPIARKFGGEDYDYTCCGYGKVYIKWQRLRSNWTALSAIRCECACELPHEVLEGKVQLKRDGHKQWYWKTTLAGAYPQQLCQLVASLAATSVSRRGWRRVEEPPLVSF